MTDGALRDSERTLSLAYVPVAARPAMTALWRLDERLGTIVTGPNTPLAAIKLAWWREALERLDSAPPPPEPLLREIAATLLPAGVTGADLAAIAAGWDALIDGEEAPAAMLTRHARERGARAFELAAGLLGGAGKIDVAAAGEIWALADLPPPFAASACAAARERVTVVRPARWPGALRALGLLAVLARARAKRPAEPAGSRRRIARSLWHGLSGW